MKLKGSPIASAGQGLDTYISQKHYHPLHTFITVLEALLMLAGAVAIILFVSQGSFAGAGEVIDRLLSTMGGMITNLFGGNAPPKAS